MIYACASRYVMIKISLTYSFSRKFLRVGFERVCHETLDFIQVPDFPSAIRVFALTHSHRNVVQR